MAWDSVPWFVGGGAEHSPEVARLLGYVAFRGNEGILGPGDCAVRALAVPGGKVRVMPGACAILNRALGGAYQAYAGRLVSEDEVDIPPTGSSGGRSDLIVARIEDPTLAGEPWQDPVDPTVGPYVFSRVIPNVPPTTKTVAELGLGYTAIALARVDVPASTGTITDAMIVDLRQVANPRRDRDIIAEGWWGTGTDDLTNSNWAEYPVGANYQVFVPAWATQVKVVATWAQIQNVTGNTYGSVRVRLGSVITESVNYDSVWNGGSYRTNLLCADRVPIPSAMRGTMQPLVMEAMRQAGQTGWMQMDGGSAIVLDYEFAETASLT